MKTIIRFLLLSGIIFTQANHASATDPYPATDLIRLNQTGFYPGARKIAVALTGLKEKFFIVSANLKDTVFRGYLTGPYTSVFSPKTTCIADFSAFTKQGSYVVAIPGLGYSYTFEIQPGVHTGVAKASMKAFYYQRASTALPETFAGKWARKAGHADTHVVVHPSAASAKRPAGTVISASKGWYDAGDYNKYIVNSGVSMGTLLSAYEDFPAFCDTLHINIPESGNGVPDILNEITWNLRWMLAMQDPEDGGVYNKLTDPGFDGMVMPEKAGSATRYVVQKGTAATLDFAAVTAQSARILKKYNKQLPGLADTCLAASKKAWEWAMKNPRVEFDQNKNNTLYEPKIFTGGYGDGDFNDEFIWAACELYITTHDNGYYKAVKIFPDENMPLPGWPQVRLMGYYSLLRFEKTLTPLAKGDIAALKKRMQLLGNTFLTGNPAYQTPMGKAAYDFFWGSNSLATNEGIVLIQAYKLTGDKKYLEAALDNLDYLLGRNGTGYSFLTGHGDKVPVHPHHRPSEADGIEEPIPGFLVGGPNRGMEDHLRYPSAIPDEAYIDEMPSYAANEIAINWNAPMVYLTMAIEALQSGLARK